MRGSRFQISNTKYGSFSLDTDETGNIESWNLNSSPHSLKIKYSKKIHRKNKERKKFMTSGISQIGPTYPIPLDREELIDFEFKKDQWYCREYISIASLIIAVLVDSMCYYTLFARENMDIIQTIISIAGAVLAIDALPIYFAYNLKKLVKNKKCISVVLCLLCFFVFMLFFSVIFCELYAYNLIPADFIFILIPVATSSLCFIAGYVSYDPLQNKLKKYKKLRMHRIDNIYELKALINEIERNSDYEADFISIENEKYKNAIQKIDALSSMYKRIVRLRLAVYLKSPADTSDLTKK